ncbi:MAG: tetratricopeptide repeat protein [Pseudomonadota bacterium]|nr:tetratricopeptide repeat protein [Pseudomonadota bacterium]
MSAWSTPVRRFGFVVFVLSLQLEIQGAEIPEIPTDHMEAAVAQLIHATRADLGKEPYSAKAWGQLGMVSHAHGLIQPAIDCYRQAAKRDPSDYRWPYLIATALRNSSGNQAIAHFTKAFELNPNDYALVIAYADSIFRNGQYRKAQDLYKVAIQIDDNQGFGLIGLARIAYVNNDLIAAERDLQKASQIDPNNREIYTLLAQVQMGLGADDAAKTAELLARTYPHAGILHAPIVEAMRSLGETADAFLARGKRMTQLGDYQSAEAAFREVLARRSGLAFDYGNLGNVLARQGKYVEALEFFEDGLALNPDDIEILSNQSLALMSDAQLDRAEKSLIRAIELDPNYGHAHFNLGVLRYRQSNYGDAVEHFNNALSANPSLTQAYLNLGTTHVAMGKFQAAIEVWKKLERIQPDNADLVFNMGLAWLRLGQDAQASSALQKALDLNPSNQQAANLLIRLLATSQHASVRDAARAIRMAKQLDSTRQRDPIAKKRSQTGIRPSSEPRRRTSVE